MSYSLSKQELETLQRLHGGRAWACVLQLQEQRGRKLNRNQVRCYRNALNLNIPAQ